MRNILRQAAFLLLSLLVVYGLVLVITLYLTPLPREVVGLDSASAADTLFVTGPKYIFLNRGPLRIAKEQVVLLGGSNVVLGIRQTELQSLVPGAVVHNLGLGGANCTELRQIVDLVGEVQTDVAKKQTIFVFGIWYGLFVEDKVRWNTSDRYAGDTDIDIERYRYGFYRRTDQGPLEVWPASRLELGVTLIRPLLVLDRIAYYVPEVLDSIVGRTRKFTDEQRDNMVVREGDKEKYFAFWSDYMGRRTGLADEQFVVLENTVNSILAAGGRVIIADLPLPHWHAQGSPFFSSYEEHKTILLSHLVGRAGFSFLEMGDANADQDFYDEVHPRPRVSKSWSRSLAAVLNPMLASSTIKVENSSSP